MGLERAGWRTVSFSEIDPYASACLAERWPGVPNLGDITQLGDGLDAERRGGTTGPESGAASREWHRAVLWTGGFPCQDLSVAGKRAGFAGLRSSLAFSFLGLVERNRPPALILENVPGLLSSNGGRDLGTLLGTLGKLGYGWAYRVLDAQFFGVPQRRRRVFIVALDTQRGFGAECAAEVLSVGSRCYRHPPTGVEAGEGVAAGIADSPDIAGAVLAREGKGIGHNYPDDHLTLVSPPPDAGRMRATDGLAGRSHDRGELAATLNSGGNDGGFRTEPGEHLVVAHSVRPRSGMPQGWNSNLVANGLRASDGHHGHSSPRGDGGDNLIAAAGRGAADNRGPEDGLLPLGLDSHRYRLVGNGVVSTVPEWFGHRLADLLA